LRRACHGRDLVFLGHQQRQQPPPDHACGAREEDPHAAAPAATPRPSSAGSGSAQTMPSLKPADPNPRARLKRPRMFSSAITLVSSTSWAALNLLRSSAKSSSGTDTGVRLIPTA